MCASVVQYPYLLGVEFMTLEHSKIYNVDRHLPAVNEHQDQ